jgi:hypothetical protein
LAAFRIQLAKIMLEQNMNTRQRYLQCSDKKVADGARRAKSVFLDIAFVVDDGESDIEPIGIKTFQMRTKLRRSLPCLTPNVGTGRDVVG